MEITQIARQLVEYDSGYGVEYNGKIGYVGKIGMIEWIGHKKGLIGIHWCDICG